MSDTTRPSLAVPEDVRLATKFRRAQTISAAIARKMNHPVRDLPWLLVPNVGAARWASSGALLYVDHIDQLPRTVAVPQSLMMGSDREIGNEVRRYIRIMRSQELTKAVSEAEKSVRSARALLAHAERNLSASQRAAKAKGPRAHLQPSAADGGRRLPRRV